MGREEETVGEEREKRTGAVRQHFHRGNGERVRVEERKNEERGERGKEEERRGGQKQSKSRARRVLYTHLDTLFSSPTCPGYRSESRCPRKNQAAGRESSLPPHPLRSA